MSAMLKKPVLWVLALALLAACVFVFNVSKPGASVEGVTDRRIDRESSYSTGIQVVSLNIFHDFPNFELLEERLTLLIMFIQDKQPDVVCLQEIPWTLDVQYGAEYVANAVGFNHVYYRANGNKSLILFEEGQAILSRYPIEETAFATLAPKAGFFENRTALYAKIDTPKGMLGVVSTHLSGDDSIQVGQVESLVNFVEIQAGALPTIVAGDFNMEPGSPAYKTATQHWSDIFYLLHPDETANTCCIENLVSPPGMTLEKRVDYIFARNGSTGKQVKLDMSYLVFEQPINAGSQYIRQSDHAGVWAQISF